MQKPSKDYVKYILVASSAICAYVSVLCFHLMNESKNNMEGMAKIIKLQNKKLTQIQNEDRLANKKIESLNKDLDNLQLTILHLQNELKNKRHEKRS